MKEVSLSTVSEQEDTRRQRQLAAMWIEEEKMAIGSKGTGGPGRRAHPGSPTPSRRLPVQPRLPSGRRGVRVACA